MLKSLVFVALFCCLIVNALPASAYTPVLSRQMQKYVASYLKENDEELAAVRERSYQPFTIIDSVMEHYDLPVELRYLAVIESQLKSGAVSRVGAKGPWQLMAGTARELGLKVGYRTDERTNYYKSTVAAALYLRDLHREYKDWLLVLAAYNAGPVPVNRAIRLAGSRNFWAIEQYLPKETRGHVRRFIATEYYFSINAPMEAPGMDNDVALGGAKIPVLSAAVTPTLSGGHLPLLSGAVVGVPGLAGAGLSDGVPAAAAGMLGTAWRRNEPVM